MYGVPGLCNEAGCAIVGVCGGMLLGLVGVCIYQLCRYIKTNIAYELKQRERARQDKARMCELCRIRPAVTTYVHEEIDCERDDVEYFDVWVCSVCNPNPPDPMTDPEGYYWWCMAEGLEPAD